MPSYDVRVTIDELTDLYKDTFPSENTLIELATSDYILSVLDYIIFYQNTPNYGLERGDFHHDSLACHLFCRCCLARDSAHQLYLIPTESRIFLSKRQETYPQLPVISKNKQSGPYANHNFTFLSMGSNLSILRRCIVLAISSINKFMALTINFLD